MKKILFFISCLLLSCSYFQKPVDKKDHLVQKVWIREAFAKNYRRASLLQSVRTVMTSSLVIQGNQADGVSAYTKNKGKKRWSFSVKGGVAGNLLVSGGYVFFGGADGFLYALRVKNGQLFWKYYTGAVRTSGPILKDGRIYFASPNKLYCLSAKNGERKWTYSVSVKNFDFVTSGIAEPLLTKYSIYFRTSDDSIFSLNYKGQLRWKKALSKIGAYFTSASAGMVIGKTCLYVPTIESGLYCLRPSNGKVIWKQAYGSYADVLLSGSRLFYPTSDGRILALDQKSGKLLWEHNLSGSVATALVSYKDILIYGEYTGALKFLSKKTGSKEGAFFFGSGLSAKPLLSVPERNIYFLSNAGFFYKLKILF